MRVIVTHSERNRLLRQKPERLAAWVNQGAYLQMTGQSLQGFVGSEAKKFAELLMEKGRVHFLASDAHDVQRRPPRLDQAWKLVSDKYGAEYAEALLKSPPQAVIDGYEIEAGLLEPPEKRRKWLGIFSYQSIGGPAGGGNTCAADVRLEQCKAAHRQRETNEIRRKRGT